jgi:metallo-beta-lactamase class B
MFGNLAWIVAAQLVPIVSVPLQKTPRHRPVPIAPIETAGPEYAAACKDSDDWERPAPPVRIHANTFMVGTCGISSILIAGDSGHILIDGGTEADADLIADNVRALGFRVEDIRIILNSHEHPDHIGGISRLQRMSGATLMTSAAAAKVFTSGVAGPDDPQAGISQPVPTAVVGRIVQDGDEVRLGNLMLTAIATPGHTRGALSWRWVSCDGGVCRTIVYADSLTPVSGPKYRFSDHPAALAAFRASIAKIAETPCDILITPHPSASDMKGRFALGQPLLGPGACRAYGARVTHGLDDRLAAEHAGK